MVRFIKYGVASVSFHTFRPIFQAHLFWGTKINLQVCSVYWNNSVKYLENLKGRIVYSS